MRFLDAGKLTPLYNVQMYLTPKEAKTISAALARLLQNPDAENHEHVFADDMSRELSFSIVTPSKLQNIERYTEPERRMFAED